MTSLLSSAPEKKRKSQLRYGVVEDGIRSATEKGKVEFNESGRQGKRVTSREGRDGVWRCRSPINLVPDASVKGPPCQWAALGEAVLMVAKDLSS